jgi:malate dehydrogenase (oxaloacetate-decarboxylating)
MPRKTPSVLQDSLTNRGTAFIASERARLGLIGRLPPAVSTLDEQADRAYAQLQARPTDLAKNQFMASLQDTNEVLFYRLLVDHLVELNPIVYDPTVGDAIEQYSHEYRRPRGVYLSIDHQDQMRESFEGLGLGPDDVDLIVVTDAQEILGIGDWGVNGIDICVGKLAVYTGAAGIHPGRTIAVGLDCGTDNQVLLNDPLYLGNRHSRTTGKAYDDFIALYLQTVSELFPHALYHFEDFGPSNARRILDDNAATYRIFNDDVEGTGAIVLASVISALKVTGQSFRDQRLVVFGSGTAGCGIADALRDAMIHDGASREEAISQVWLVDKQGLLNDDMVDLRNYQQPYARPAAEIKAWSDSTPDLLTTIKHVKPTILLGTSTVHGAFTKPIINAMCAGVDRPIILPISNPTSRIEAMPSDVIPWSDGKALVAVGIPVDPVPYKGVDYQIGQANNALLYPGLALGTIVCRAKHVTPNMLVAAADAVAGQVDPTEPGALLLPPVAHLRASSTIVAAAVVQAAIDDDVATVRPENVVQAIQNAMWEPVYGPGQDR